jgi:hypothetical protein
MAGCANDGILNDPGFEAAGQSAQAWQAEGDGTVTWQGGQARTGKQSIRFEGPDASSVSQGVSAAPGDKFTFRVWARSKNGNGAGALRLLCLDSSGRTMRECVERFRGSRDWAEESVSITAASDSCRLVVQVVGIGNETLFIDDAELTKEPAKDVLVFDVTDTLHAVDGFGTQVWADRPHGIDRLDDLNVKYVRLAKDRATWEQLQHLRAVTDELDIKWVYMMWRAPRAYRDRDGHLNHVHGFATHWRKLVVELDGRGLRPHYIELMNEPDSDGSWSTAIAPSQYNALVRKTRAELDRAGYDDVGIVGPGVAHLDWKKHNEEWISALDDTAVADLAAWSTHAWDDGDFCHGGAACIEQQWDAFGGATKDRDPDKPKWITEYATKETTLHGVEYPHPDHTSGYSTANTMPYAVRVCENAIALLNAGATVVFYWHAEDGDKAWGVVDTAGRRKPVFHTLKNLFGKIPDGARVVRPPDQSESGLYAGAFVKNDRLVIAFTNDDSVTRHATLQLKNAGRFSIEHATACVCGRRGDAKTQTPDTCREVSRDLKINRDGHVKIRLPADSTITIECRIQPGKPSATAGR